jgi:site-specific DNA recombinase
MSHISDERKIMKAILYIRVSTGRQAEHGVSLANQEARLRQYAIFRGITNVELIADEGASGKNTDRPGFQRMIRAVRCKEVDAVMVYSLSRFARNTVATLGAISVMEKAGVAFHSLTEQLDTSSSIGRFFLTTLAALAQLEREQISERTRSVMQHMKANGRPMGQIPFGKKVVSGLLVDDVPEQETIMLVGELQSQGVSLTAMARELTSRKIRNKAGKVSWTKQQVWRICRSHCKHTLK